MLASYGMRPSFQGRLHSSWFACDLHTSAMNTILVENVREKQLLKTHGNKSCLSSTVPLLGRNEKLKKRNGGNASAALSMFSLSCDVSKSSAAYLNDWRRALASASQWHCHWQDEQNAYTYTGVGAISAWHVPRYTS